MAGGGAPAASAIGQRAKAELSRAAFPIASYRRRAEPWPRRRTESTRRVVLDLVLGQLESDEMFEGRVRDRGADRRVGQRIDRGLRFTRLARAGENLADVRRECRGAAVDPHGR